jgi:hypothetical protein
MPNGTSNITLYATLAARYPVINLASATAANTNTLVITGAATATIVTDILFRSADATARSFDIIICATGSQAAAENARVQITVPIGAGNTGTVAIASLAALAPSMFDIDLAGNRVITLESGQSIYVRNTTLTAGAIFITAKARDY